jgi:hypothetical protein
LQIEKRFGIWIVGLEVLFFGVYVYILVRSGLLFRPTSNANIKGATMKGKRKQKK